MGPSPSMRSFFWGVAACIVSTVCPLSVSGSVLIMVEQRVYRRSFAILYPVANQDVDVLCGAVNLW